MDTQAIINVAIGVIGFLGGWVLKVVWESLKDLQAADKELTEKVATIEILVAGSCVTREDFANTIRAVFTKLDRIEDKIDHKADR